MVSTVKLGVFIEKLNRPNSELIYGIDDVCGITNTKQITIGTKANLIGRTFEKFTILKPREFIFNRRTSRNGDRISLGFNSSDRNWILTEDYCHFRIKKEKESELLPEYLYLFFLNSEFDRYVRFNSWGSATEFFNWEEMIDVPICIPSIKEQCKIVHDYKVITDRIELLEKINENLEEQATNIFVEKCIKSKTSQSWNDGVFDDIILKTISGDWGLALPEKNNISRVVCFRGADMPNLNKGITTEAPIRYILKKNYEVKKLKANNFIVEISGGSPTQSTGRISIVPSEVIEKCNDEIICSNFCKGVEVNSSYIYYFFCLWKYLYNNKKMFDFENGTTGLKNFSFDTFVSMEKIKIPPEKFAVYFNNTVQPIYHLIFQNGFEIEKLMSLKETILSHVMKERFK